VQLQSLVLEQWPTMLVALSGHATIPKWHLLGVQLLFAGAVAGSKLQDHVTDQHGATGPSSGGYSHPSRPLCKYFAAGHCKDGGHCRYTHANPAVGGVTAGGSRGRKLVVRVKNASGLRNTDGPFAGKSDPYVILRLVDGREDGSWPKAD